VQNHRKVVFLLVILIGCRFLLRHVPFHAEAMLAGVNVFGCTWRNRRKRNILSLQLRHSGAEIHYQHAAIKKADIK